MLQERTSSKLLKSKPDYGASGAEEAGGVTLHWPLSVTVNCLLKSNLVALVNTFLFHFNAHYTHPGVQYKAVQEGRALRYY